MKAFGVSQCCCIHTPAMPIAIPMMAPSSVNNPNSTFLPPFILPNLRKTACRSPSISSTSLCNTSSRVSLRALSDAYGFGRTQSEGAS